MRLTTTLVCLLSAPALFADSWSQFRGPGNQAAAVGTKSLPTEISPTSYILWKTPLAPGHSSPVIHEGRIFLTAIEKKKLYTLALDRATGKELWRREAPLRSLEKVHKVGNQAQSTAATDGKHVVVFFGSAGLFCYDVDGKEIWNLPMGPFKAEFGSATSPLLVDGKVILNRDFDEDSCLTMYDVKTGAQIWKTDRAEFPSGYCTPVIWEVEGKKQIVQGGTLRIVGYDFDTGQEIWTVRDMARICNMTPTIGKDNILYLAAWAAGADPSDAIVAPSFEVMIGKRDKNMNGTIEAGELTDADYKDRFANFDRNRDAKIDQREWESMRAIFNSAKNRMVAVKPGGKGDITATHVLWEQAKQLPYVPSPVLANDSIFMVKNGGMVSSLDAKTGKLQKTARIPGTGAYFSSPVTGDGKVYIASQDGQLTVISAESDWKILHAARFEEEIFATPALLDGKIYLRTSGHLYCFGTK